MVATEHSPNRKERKARDPAKRWRGNARSNAIETKKKRIVNGVAVGMTRKDAAIAAGMSPDGLTKLLKTHPGLEKKIEKAEEEYRRVAVGVIDEHLEESAKEFVRLGLHAESEKVRANVLGTELRGRGVLVEKPVVELNQDNRAINIIVRGEGGQELVKELISGVRRNGHRNDNSDQGI